MKEAKLTKRQQQAIDTKKKIIGSTIFLLKTKSFENVKIKDICNEAGISVGNFYYYFDGKAEVLEEGYLIINQGFLARIGEIDPGLDPLARINQAFKIFAAVCNDFGFPFISVLMRYELFTNTQHINTSDQELFAYIDQALEEALEEEVLVGASLDLVQSKIYRIFKGTMYEWIIKEASFSLYDELLIMNDLVLAPYRAG